jgi:hypothetical protein
MLVSIKIFSSLLYTLKLELQVMMSYLQYFSILVQCSATFFLNAAHPDLSKTHDGMLQNVASRKGGTKLYMTINTYLHINTCRIRMQAYENKTLQMLDKTIDDEI